jgi:hypothetical protein
MALSKSNRASAANDTFSEVGCGGAAELPHQADSGHVDIATVANGVVDAIALVLGAQGQRFAQLVFQAQPDFRANLALLRMGSRHGVEAIAAEIGLGLGVGSTYPADDRQAFGQGQLADQVKINAAKTGVRAQASIAGHGIEAEGAELVVTGFHCEVVIELLAAEDLEAWAVFPVFDKGHAA